MSVRGFASLHEGLRSFRYGNDILPALWHSNSSSLGPSVACAWQIESRAQTSQAPVPPVVKQNIALRVWEGGQSSLRPGYEAILLVLVSVYP